MPNQTSAATLAASSRPTRPLRMPAGPPCIESKAGHDEKHVAFASPYADPLALPLLAIATKSPRRHRAVQQARCPQHVGGSARAIEPSAVTAVASSVHVRR